ncbi:hypothetical protein LCGC14_0414320 [marine sediment metagenome]|uniref:Uncharacterized protein n=1 Tax=marine sediment metagenome TaxID=412755 RepID=A0A0F9TAN4_9ZZZZ
MITVVKNGADQIMIGLAEVSLDAVLTIDSGGMRIVIGREGQLGKDETPDRYKTWIDGYIAGRLSAREK